MLSLQLKALRQLTGANPDFLQRHINTKEEAWSCLKERMPHQQVFLALDNVSDKRESLDFAGEFLHRLKYQADSMVMVTSRSKDVLQKLGIPDICCIHSPRVTREEAEKIVLHHIDLLEVGDLTSGQIDVLQKTIDMCDFGGFHPMALKVLAAQLGRDPSSWKLSNLNLSETSDIDHMLFTPMEVNFSRLPDQQTKDMFMDIALFTPLTVDNATDLCRWLRDTLHSSCGTVDHVRRKLNVLRLKSFLEVWSIDSDKVCIHDLHHELAKKKAQVDDASDTMPLRFLFQTCGEEAPTVYTERACFVGANCTILALGGCSKLKLLSARSCQNLMQLTLQGLSSLVSLELSACPLQTLDLRGLFNLRWLCLTSCGELVTLEVRDCKRLVCVQISRCPELEGLDLENCEVLQSLSVSFSNNLMSVHLGGGKCLQRLALWSCEGLRAVKIRESACLSEFKKRGCPQLLNVQGCNIGLTQDVSCLILNRWHKVSKEFIMALQGSRCLQVLDLWECPISRLPDLRDCSDLQELKLTNVDVVLDSDDRGLLHEYVDILCACDDDLALPTSLQEVTIGDCRNTVVKEICWKLHGVQRLKVLLLQRVRVCWDWEFYRSNSKSCSRILMYCQDSKSKHWNSCNLERARLYLHKKIKRMHAAVKLQVSRKKESAIYSTAGEADDIRSVEAPADDGNRFDQTIPQSIASTSGESGSGPNAAFKYLYLLIHSIQGFLRRGNRHTEGIQAQIERIIENFWHKLRKHELHLEDYEAIDDRWVRLVVCDAMKQVQYCYGSPDYVLLETFNNLDNLKVWFLRLNIRHVSLYFRCFEAQAAEQLRRQLMVVRALGPEQKFHAFFCHPWEHEVMQEISLFENIMWSVGNANTRNVWRWERLAEDGILFSSERVNDLEANVLSELETRYWKKKIDEETVNYNDFELWRQDWLQSCKICLLGQLFTILVRQNMGHCQTAFWSCFLGMMLQIEHLLQTEVREQLKQHRRPAGTTHIHVDDSVIENVCRSWKAYQWLEKVASLLFREWEEADIKFEIVDELLVTVGSSIGETDDILFNDDQFISKAAYQECRPRADLQCRDALKRYWGGKAKIHGLWPFIIDMQGGHLSCKRMIRRSTPPADNCAAGAAGISSELEIWRRGERFPLRDAWDAINQQSFSLPLRRRPAHLSISSSANVTIPPVLY